MQDVKELIGIIMRVLDHAEIAEAEVLEKGDQVPHVMPLIFFDVLQLDPTPGTKAHP